MVDAGATAEKAGLAEAGYDNPTSKQIDRTVNLLEGSRALYREGGPEVFDLIFPEEAES